MERQRIVFSGRVQGVGFRATARSVSSGFEVTGWVRNCEDGTVEMEIQGVGAEVRRCLEALRARMRGLVRGERAERTGVVEGESAFEIRR